MPRKKQVKLTKKIKELIIDSIHNGILPAELVKNNPDKVPSLKTILRYEVSDEKFGTEMTTAYYTYFMQLLAEYNYISKTPAHLVYTDCDERAAENTRKARMKALEQLQNKVAPLLTNRLDKTSKVEVAGKVEREVTINVIDYAPKTLINVEKDVD